MSEVKSNRQFDIDQILSEMTLEEKCGLLTGAEAFKTRAYKRHHIPALTFSDGPHGLRKQAEGANHLGIGGSIPATCFPTAATVANSWDPSLGEMLGEALGEEAAAQSVNVMLGPGLNIKRNPLCGRNFEYFSEDPYLAGKMAAGYVRGMQKNGLSACPKHFAVNSQEHCRMSVDSVVDERTLREIYLTGFEIVVKEAKPKTIMTSYNRVNGIYANENPHLLKDILKKEWGYDGTIVTDWGGSNHHVEGVRNGSNFEMPSPGLDPVIELVDAVRNGEIEEAVVDQRVAEALELILTTDQVIQNTPDQFDRSSHHQVAEKVAEQSMVLLKNENILPLKPKTKVALIGDFVETPRYQGAGSSLVNPTKLENLKDAVEQTTLQTVGFAKGYERNGAASASLKTEAVNLAKQAEIVLFVMGLDEIKESEGLDRKSMKINENQIEVLREVSEANPNVVVLLCGGSSVEMPWATYAKGILYACLGGQAWATAALRILTGEVNPSGKLAETYPMQYKDVPSAGAFPSRKKTAEYREGIYVGYRYFDKVDAEVRYPFGYGLSYTSFLYSDFEVKPDGVRFVITNTGTRDGAEVAQLYIGMEESAVFRPKKELKGFTKVFLKAGESKKVEIPFDDKTFRYFDVKENGWRVEEGDYTVMIGAHSRDIRLKSIYHIEGSKPANPYEGRDMSCYEVGKVDYISDQQFENLLGRPIPTQEIVIDRNITFNQLNHGRSPIFWLVWLVMTLLMKLSEKSGKPNLNLMFIYNMPLRGLQKMTGGAFSMGMVDALVMEVKGFWIIGIVRFLVELIKNLIRNANMAKRLNR